MKSEIQKFLIKTSLIAVVLVIAGYIAFTFIVPEYYLPVYWLALVFFYVFTLAVHAWQVNTAIKSMAKFTRTNMVATFLKLMVYAAFTIIYLAINTEKAIPFVVVVMILYIIFTATEVTSLTKFARKMNQKGKE